MKKALKQSTLMNIINLVSIVLVIIIAVFVCLMAVYTAKIGTASTDRFDLTFNANRFMNGSSYLTNEVRAYAATGDSAHYENYWNEINNLKNRDIGVETMKSIGITKQEQDMIEQMSALSNQLVPLESAAMDKVKAGDMENAIQSVFGASYKETIAKIASLKNNFLTMLDERMLKEIAVLQRQSTLIDVVSFLLVAALIVLQVFSIRITRRKIIHPISVVKDEMIAFSKGNLHSAFHLEPDTSEIGMLVASVIASKKALASYIEYISNALQENAKGNFRLEQPQFAFVGDFVEINDSIQMLSATLSETLSQIIGAADKVSSGSDQVSSSAQTLAQGATKQTNAVQELAASIGKISSQVKQNAKNASQANDMATDATQAITASNDQMQRLMKAMHNINAKSAEIRKIIKTIEDIAFQTNILALNAAVEAARAGAAGKGFAVVADEVRNLAGKSAQAANNTTKLIEDSVASIGEGVTLAEATAEDLVGAVDSVKQTTNIIAAISVASGEQAASIAQVTTEMDQISSVVQTNSASSEESAAAAEELSSQANLLKALVSEFTLQDHKATH